MGPFLLSLASTLIGLSEPPTVHSADSRDTYELVIGTTQGLLPGQLQEYLGKNLGTIQKMAVAPDLQMATDSKSPFSNPDHYLKLDIAEKGADLAARRSAARSFPKDRKAAKALFEQHQEKDGGSLPWVMEDQFRQLQSAFESGTREAINGHWAVITHFATDAAMPFSTTFDLSGESSSESKWCSPGSASSEAVCSLRERFQRSLLTRQLNRLWFEVRVTPERARQMDDPVQAVFDVFLESHDAMIRIVEADRQIIADLKISDLDHFHAASDAYYSHLADRCGPILEERIETASLLAANLIRTAWIRAGRPNLAERFPDPVDLAAGKQASEKTPTNQPEQPATSEKPFGGSVNSTIFHRTGCSHLQRVKPENVVYFATVEEAQTAGRTPCKTCKP